MNAVDPVKRHYSASAANDVDGMVADFSADIVWKEADGYLTAGTYIGPEAVIEGVFAPTARTWNDFRVEIDKLVSDGDTVVMIGTYSGVHAVTGNRLHIRTVHLWTVSQGKIVAFEQICDSHPAQVAAQN